MERVRVARIGKPHGIKGEVTVELFTDSPESRFAPRSQFFVDRDGLDTPPFPHLTVNTSRWHKDILLVSFDEFSDRTTAESLREYYLFAAPLETPAGEDAWYADDLIGFVVRQGSTRGDKIGDVANLITGEHQDLLAVRLTDGKETLVPFVEEIVPEINVGQKIVVITPPPGLLEL